MNAFCEKNQSGTGGFSSQRANNTECYGMLEYVSMRMINHMIKYRFLLGNHKYHNAI